VIYTLERAKRVTIHMLTDVNADVPAKIFGD
jgi:hypothetical protein